MGFTVFTVLIWLDLLPAAMLRDAVVILLGWAAFSTLLVGSAGAWIAFARARARAHARSRAPDGRRLTTHRG